MDSPVIKLDPWSKTLNEKEKNSWKFLNLTQIGYIGEGLFQKAPSPYTSILKDHFRKQVLPIETFLEFSTVSENQLIKSSLPSNMFSRGSILSRRHLKYKVHKAEARLVRSILEMSGFSYTDSHDWTVMWLGCNAKLYLYEGLNSSQRINHFPNSYEITRKDRMCANLMSMQRKFGSSDYGFFPETFIIPNEFNDFYLRYRNDREGKWIVKPANSSQGRGIFILDNINNLRTCDSCVVSRFIHNPLLINDLKFDLRIYVLVTCFSPLKIYVYDEGLARFASEKYSNFNKSNKFSFLTNYSINKLNEKYVQNEDSDLDSQGHKWSLSALIKYLKALEVDCELIIQKIYDLIIKTIITAESTVVSLVRKYDLSPNNCFDLFGFDILIDENLRPWLLEVNLSPSLATESPLDLNIKGHLVSELFNIIGIKNHERRPATHSSNRLKPRGARPQTAKAADNSKTNELIQESFAEFLRAEHFVRVYPFEGCQVYDKYFAVPRKINKVLYHAMFAVNSPQDIEKFVITGEDLLIEYLIRILAVSDKLSFKKNWENSVQEFVSNEIWKNIGIKMNSKNYVEQLAGITAELKKRNLKNEEFQNQKAKTLENFTAEQIEMSLKQGRNEINNLVSAFFKENSGVLSQIQTFLSQTPKRTYIKLISNKNLAFQQESIRKSGYLRSTSHTFGVNRQKRHSDSSEGFQTVHIPFY
jgi:tubulin polyglutamylase TTLL5